MVEFVTDDTEDFVTWARRMDSEEGYHVDYEKVKS